MSEAEERQPGLSRARVVAAALELVREEGVGALTMRALADRLEVKAASLYWHVRDRRELLELLAESILQQAPGVDARPGWRAAALRACAAFAQVIAANRDAARILFEAPGVLDRSGLLREATQLLAGAGLPGPEAYQTARMMLVYTLYGGIGLDERTAAKPSTLFAVAVEMGSRGITLRAGAGGDAPVRVPRETTAAAAATVDGQDVLVRRRRGVGRAEVELSPKYAWRVRVKGPTWNTVLDLAGLDVRGIELDGGAAKVDIILPRPRGVVPIKVSGGAGGVSLHRPPGAPVTAEVSMGALKVRLDAFFVNAATADAHWETAGAGLSPDRYAVSISGAAVQVALDADAPSAAPGPGERGAGAAGEPALALEVVLDGVEQRIRS